MVAKLSKERLSKIKNEIKMAEALNEEELEPVISESWARYVGSWTPNFGGDWNILLNEVYPIVQNFLPSIFFRNPRAFLKPKQKTFIKKARDPLSGKMESVQADSAKSAKTQEGLLNYDLLEMKYKKQVRKVLLDALLAPHAVLWHGYKGDFGMTEEDSFFIKDERIFVKRINPLRFLKDPCVGISEIDEGKWVARSMDIPLEELIEDDKLDVDKKLIKGFVGFGDTVGTKSEMLHKMAGGKDTEKISGLYKQLLDFTDKDFQKGDGAKFVRVYEVFMRPTKKEKRDGSKGKILLLTNEQDKPLRESEWGIKAEGFPAKILSFNELNDTQFDLADIDVYKSVADQKNIIINQQINNAEEMGKTWVGLSKEGANEEDIEAVQQGGNSIVTFESGNPRDRMFVASGAGQGSSELYMLDGRIQRNLEDKSGVTDLKRGVLQSGEESATSVKIRSAGSSARPLYRQDIMADFLKESFGYINQLQKQFFSFKEAVRVLGTLDIEWTENPSKEDIQAEVDVEIDAISMLPANPQDELRALNETLGLMLNALQSPDILAKIAKEGKTFNLTPVIEQILIRQRITDPNIFRNIEPEESEGFVSIQQLRQAEANIEAINTNKQIPFPPDENDDHVVKLEVYSSIQKLLKQQGQTNQLLEQLIQVQAALLQAAQEKNTKPGTPIKFDQPSVRSV